jgi:hypothetical protein
MSNFSFQMLKSGPYMNRIFLCLLFLAGCKEPSAFITANEVHKEKVILVLKDQTKVPGKIDILHENYTSLNYTYNDNIQFTPEGTDSVENISLYQIAGYWHGSDYYALKKLDIQLTDTYRLLFVKRLTGDSSRIQLFELYESGRGNSSGQSQYSYYLVLPSYGPLETVNTRSSAIVPMFEQKMSMIVADCPSLAKKIQTKQAGYFIPMAAFNRRTHPDVMMRIINEYNNCK